MKKASFDQVDDSYDNLVEENSEGAFGFLKLEDASKLDDY